MKTHRIILAVALLAAGSYSVMAQNNKPAPNKPAVAAPKPGKYGNVNVEQFEKLSQGTNVVILDVRTPDEFAAGHMKGAKNIDFIEKDFTEKVAALDKNKTYLVHCASGRRSAQAAEEMVKKLKFTNVYNLEGGINAWQKAGKPVEHKD